MAIRLDVFKPLPLFSIERRTPAQCGTRRVPRVVSISGVSIERTRSKSPDHRWIAHRLIEQRAAASGIVADLGIDRDPGVVDLVGTDHDQPRSLV